MTRKRTANIAYVVEEEEQSHKAQAFSKSEDHPQPSIEATEKICLCQPDPKIPRPRNGMSLRLPPYQPRLDDVPFFTLCKRPDDLTDHDT